MISGDEFEKFFDEAKAPLHIVGRSGTVRDDILHVGRAIKGVKAVFVSKNSRPYRLRIIFIVDQHPSVEFQCGASIALQREVIPVGLSATYEWHTEDEFGWVLHRMQNDKERLEAVIAKYEALAPDLKASVRTVDGVENDE